MYKHKRSVLRLMKMVFHNNHLAFMVLQDSMGNTYVFRRAKMSKK